MVSEGSMPGFKLHLCHLLCDLGQETLSLHGSVSSSVKWNSSSTYLIALLKGLYSRLAVNQLPRRLADVGKM